MGVAMDDDSIYSDLCDTCAKEVHEHDEADRHIEDRYV